MRIKRSHCVITYNWCSDHQIVRLACYVRREHGFRGPCSVISGHWTQQRILHWSSRSLKISHRFCPSRILLFGQSYSFHSPWFAASFKTLYMRPWTTLHGEVIKLSAPSVSCKQENYRWNMHRLVQPQRVVCMREWHVSLARLMRHGARQVLGVLKM